MSQGRLVAALKVATSCLVNAIFENSDLRPDTSAEALRVGGDNAKAPINRKSGYPSLKITLLILAGFTIAWADSDGPNRAESATDEGDWTNPTNVFFSDDFRAENNNPDPFPQHILRIYNFSFSIPVGATIDGIVVAIEGNSGEPNPARRDYEVALGVSGYTPNGNWKAETFNQNTDDTQTFGSSSDTWDSSLDRDDMVSSDFSVLIRDEDADYGTHKVDYVLATVYFTPAGGAVTNYKRRRIGVNK